VKAWGAGRLAGLSPTTRYVRRPYGAYSNAAPELAWPLRDPERCLLRAELLEELIRRQPKSRDDWFRLISHQLRSNTEPRQVGQYLPRVLEMIRGSVAY
jgi:hypothetical protein